MFGVGSVNIDRVMKGSIDMHIHHGPGGGSFSAYDLAVQASQAGMRAIVLKDTGYPNAPMAAMINQLVPGITLFGSQCLNAYCGGLNPHAVQSAAQMGAKVIWMPTLSAANSVNVYRKMGIPVSEEGLSLLDDRGQLYPSVLKILEIIKKYDIALATGHISPAECFAVVEEARKMGIDKIILTHPLGSETVLDQSLTLEETIQLTRMGAYAEFTFVFHLPTELSYDPEITAGQIRAIGPEKCIISTDLGLFGHNASPVEGFRMFIATLAHKGMSEEEITLMAKTNPAKLLGLDA